MAKKGAKKDEFLSEIKQINQTIRAVRNKYTYGTIGVCGDFNVRTTSHRYPLLLEQMEKSELTPTFHEKLFKWFPQKMQGLSKKPNKIDYIFTSVQVIIACTCIKTT